MGNEEQRDWLGSATPVFGDLQDKSRAAVWWFEIFKRCRIVVRVGFAR